jgi:hypothetical protein
MGREVHHGFVEVGHLFVGSEVTEIGSAVRASSLPRTKAGIRHALREPVIADLARDPRLIAWQRR